MMHRSIIAVEKCFSKELEDSADMRSSSPPFGQSRHFTFSPFSAKNSAVPLLLNKLKPSLTSFFT